MIITDILANGLFDAFIQLARLAPFWLPVAVTILFWEVWVAYVRAKFISGQEMIVLEIKLPREVFKSPRAMEIALSALHQLAPFEKFSTDSLYGRFWQGKVRAVTSLEIMSLGGKIHFYIHCRKGLRNVIESHIYAQYSEVIIEETDDYTKRVPYGAEGSDWEMWGMDYALTKEDPYPIKTYIDYGLDKDPKEEFKTDPLTPILEFLGSIAPGEQIWFQIMVMATRERFRKPNTFFGKQDWKDEGLKLVEKLMKREELKKLEPGKVLPESYLSPGEREIVQAIERSISKIGFDCGMRSIYLARKDKFNPTNIGGLFGLLRPFSTLNLNGFKPARTTSFELPWQDPFGIRIRKKKRELFEAYCKRGYFFPPYDRKPFVLNAEELATIYHFPGSVAETPTLGRVETKRAEAPVNLPVV